jgi:hypothetical protein
MQVQKKNSIGNQAFVMLLYLLMLDAGLYGFGFRWISYPANVMIILTLTAGIYVIRLITANAFVGPAAKTEKPLMTVVMTMFFAALISAAILVLMNNTSFSSPGQIEEISAPLLFITAGVAMVVAITTLIIKRIQNREDE